MSRQYVKTVPIYAVRWMDNDNDERNEVGNDHAATFLGDSYGHISSDERGDYILVKTLEGDHKGRRGDWLAKGIKGECWPIAADVFDRTYSEVILAAYPQNPDTVVPETAEIRGDMAISRKNREAK